MFIYEVFKIKMFVIKSCKFIVFLFQEGSIGHDIVIRPVPTELTSNYKDSGTHHIVYKRKVDNMDQNSDFGKYFIIMIIDPPIQYNLYL